MSDSLACYKRKRSKNLLTFTVNKAAFLWSGGRRSEGIFILRVEIEVTNFNGTGITCISPMSPFLTGDGVTPPTRKM